LRERRGKKKKRPALEGRVTYSQKREGKKGVGLAKKEEKGRRPTLGNRGVGEGGDSRLPRKRREESSIYSHPKKGESNLRINMKGGTLKSQKGKGKKEGGPFVSLQNGRINLFQKKVRNRAGKGGGKNQLDSAVRSREEGKRGGSTNAQRVPFMVVKNISQKEWTAEKRP